jgi:DnaJ-domain-containing protein 1
MSLLLEEALALGVSNPGLLAPFAALPVFAAGYLRYRISAGGLGFNFQLRQLESVELERSLLLYKKVSDRLAEIAKEAERVEGSLLARFQQRKTLRKKFADEREDLEQYAAHLRSAILRLRGKPVLRFKFWRHALSAQFALARSLGSYFAVCSAGLIASCCLEQQLLLDAADVNFELLPLWNFIPSPLMYANWVAAGFMLVTTPVLYLYRQARLHAQHRARLRSFKEFANADPDRLIEKLRIEDEAHDKNDDKTDGKIDGKIQDEGGEKPFQHSDESEETITCFAVLGIPPSATVEQVKEAYKLHVKQNHPDRVQGMSSIFTELAETETKKLNLAYEEALLALHARESVPSHAMA